MALVGLILIVTAGAVSVTMATAVLVVSACAIAETETVVVVGNSGGAVYRPVVLIVPLVASPPTTPFTCQVTAVFVEPVTVAVNCWVVAPATLAVVGEIVMVTPAAVVSFLPPHPAQISAGISTRKRNRFGKMIGTPIEVYGLLMFAVCEYPL